MILYWDWENIFDEQKDLKREWNPEMDQERIKEKQTDWYKKMDG